MSTVLYPFSLVEKSGAVNLLLNEADLLENVEAIDIVRNEYSGWDCTGKKLLFRTLEGKTVAIVAESVGKPSELREIIIAYARKEAGVALPDCDSVTDLAALYRAAEALIESKRTNLYRQIWGWLTGTKGSSNSRK